MIEKNAEMLLFRYSEFKHYDFIKEHKAVLAKNGYVWMLKSGRKSNPDKLSSIIEQGGWLILKQPKNAGGKYYICQFDAVQEYEPADKSYPDYYKEFVSERLTNEQWFRLISINEMPDIEVDKIVLCKNENKVIDIIGTTMTSVMFVKNSSPIGL